MPRQFQGGLSDRCDDRVGFVMVARCILFSFITNNEIEKLKYEPVIFCQ